MGGRSGEREQGKESRGGEQGRGTGEGSRGAGDEEQGIVSRGVGAEESEQGKDQRMEIRGEGAG